MSKKKQVTFQNNIPGKFIPRENSPAAAVIRSSSHDNRFNSKMAELLASSSLSPSRTTDPASEPLGCPSSTDEAALRALPENQIHEASRAQSKVLRRRIVTMLETLRRRGGNPNASSPTRSTDIDVKTAPITFGDLRKATISNPPLPPSSTLPEQVTSNRSVSSRPYLDRNSPEIREKSPRRTTAPASAPLPTKQQTNREPMHYSPSPEQLRESPAVLPTTQEPHLSPLTVDEIIATYYSKLQLASPPTVPTPSMPVRTAYPTNPNMNFYAPPVSSVPGWNPPATQFLLNDQNKHRPPPPSYSSSVANTPRPVPSATSLAQHLIRPPAPLSVLEQFHPTNAPISRPPPPRYEPSAVNADPSPSPVVQAQGGFDREFSRLLYGKEARRNRHQRQKRKAFSDPVKKSVEEAGKSMQKPHRRLTTHLNRKETVKEEEETSSDSYEIESRSSNRSSRTAIVPANPFLKKPIPSFLRVYAQAPASNDILLQWHLFTSAELQSFAAMMTKLYKDENFIRVQSYEYYRAALVALLASKTSSAKEQITLPIVSTLRVENDDDDSITTTAL